MNPITARICVTLQALAFFAGLFAIIVLLHRLPDGTRTAAETAAELDAAIAEAEAHPPAAGTLRHTLATRADRLDAAIQGAAP